jgi:hypothetical protein
MNHIELITELKEVELKENNSDHVKKLIQQFGKFGVIVTTLHKGKKIIRARLAESEEFEKVSELSYKPQEYNTTYQRASTPFRTMFYGSIVPKIKGELEPDSARFTVASELSQHLRSLDSVGEEDIVFSIWEVQDDIELVSLVHHQKFERPTKLSIQLRKEFEEVVKNSPETANKMLEVSEFLGNEFAKLSIGIHTDYMISALFSELVTKSYDGVLYPSVRLAGEGINIAITNKSADEKLCFMEAMNCTIYKNKKKAFIGSNYKLINENGQLIRKELDTNEVNSKDFGRKKWV